MVTIDQIVLIFFRSPYIDWIKHIKNIKNIKIQYINTEPSGECMRTKKLFDNKNVISKQYKHKIDLRHIISCDNINIYVPLSIDQQYFYDNSIIKHKLCGNNKQHIDIFNQKCLFIYFMINNKLLNLIPNTYAINYSHELVKSKPYFAQDGIQYFKNVKFPCIIKQNISAGGDHVVIIYNEKMLEDYKNIYVDYVVQEFIVNEDKTEYTCDFYIDNGNIVTSVYYKDNSVRQTLFYIQHGGLRDKIKINDMNKYNNEFEKIFKILNYTGFACIDFTLIENKIKIFEINPRLGGTLVTDAFDFENFLTEILNMFVAEKYI